MFRIKKRLRGKRNPNPRNNSMQKDREDKILEAVRDFMREGLKDMREHGGDYFIGAVVFDLVKFTREEFVSYFKII